MHGSAPADKKVVCANSRLVTLNLFKTLICIITISCGLPPYSAAPRTSNLCYTLPG